MALSPARSRLFVVAFVTMLLGLSVFAAIAITRGWKNEDVQRVVRQNEEERR
ncbi:MAG TPA: hypothetical protein VF576_06395 [Rubricoccaceae bacterium]|jgi:hypothetical protein